LHVGVDHGVLTYRPNNEAVTAQRHRPGGSECFSRLGGLVIVRHQMHQLTVKTINTAVRGIAQAPGAPHDSFEDRPYIGLRSADDG
jgi:hypothetical protein